MGRIGGWGGGVERLGISPLGGAGQEVILTLIKGGCNFILRPTLLILEPPLQIIIAQSLNSTTPFTRNLFMQINTFVIDNKLSHL